MDITTEKLSPGRIAVTVRAPSTELESFVPRAVALIGQELELEGFRKGKIPADVVKKTVGEFKVLEEAARLYIQKTFPDLLADVEGKEFSKSSFEPIGEPAITITKLSPGENLEYRVELTYLPELSLPDYTALARDTLKGKHAPDVTPEEIASATEWLRESRSKLITVNRGAKKGDRVEIDFSTAAGGVEIEGGTSKNHPLTIGDGKMMPGFEDNLTGMKAGEEKTFSLSTPADYRVPSIAGKHLDFKVAMKLVQERELPDWTDDFAKSLGNFSSTVDVESSIRQGLKHEKEERERERLRMAVIEAIAARTKVEIPDPLIERETEKMIAELRGSTERMGLAFEDYLNNIKKTAQDLKKDWRPNAEKRVKIALVLREIARRENIEPTEEEIQEAINRTIEHQGLSEEMIRKLDQKAFFDYHRGIARNEKVFALLESLA